MSRLKEWSRDEVQDNLETYCCFNMKPRREIKKKAWRGKSRVKETE